MRGVVHGDPGQRVGDSSPEPDRTRHSEKNAPLHQRTLGPHGLTVSHIGFGCMSLPERDQARVGIHAALDAGDLLRHGLDPEAAIEETVALA